MAAFTAGLRRDLRSVGQLVVATSPVRRLVLRGPWVNGEHDMAEVVAVQVWCDCGGAGSVAPQHDGMEVLLRGGRSVRVVSGTAFDPDVAVTLSELAAGVAIAGVVDLVAVVVLFALDRLPASGPWRTDTVVGHLAFVAVTTLVLIRAAGHARNGSVVATPSGAVFAGGVREPFLWLSGKSDDNRPVSRGAAVGTDSNTCT